MDISVIVVTYNQEETIGRTLDSLLCQDFEGEWEIIIGDDCSTDGTGRICSEYAARYPDRIKYVRRDKNVGVTANYFDCILRAKGTFLADCAGDDCWCDPGKLRRQTEFLRSHPDFTMVATDWLCVSPDSKEPFRHPKRPVVLDTEVWEKGTLIASMLNHSALPHLCSSLYRRDAVLEEMERNPELMHQNDWQNEDVQIVLACSAAGKVAVLPGVSLLYTCGTDSISNSTKIARRFNYTLSSLQQMLLLAERYRVERGEFAEWIASTSDYLWALAFHSGNPELRSRLLQTMKNHDLPYKIKGAIYRIATSSPFLWKPLAKIHKP